MRCRLLTTLKLPELLQMPAKLYPVLKQINDYRYFLLEGGRGGGKSQAIARIILYLAEQRNIRVVCGRETQNSINESVYLLFSDLIRKNNLASEVLSTKITSRISGSTINFRGFREQGAFNIQGMEGIDITWIDEAQALTKQTIDVLIPTIRKDTAKIFFTMNRHVVDDPVYAMFVGRSDCLHIHIDYFDNPYCTEALKHEAEECKKKSIKDYTHIWLGEPLEQAEDCVFGYQELKATQSINYELKPQYGLKLAGFDIARFGDDKCACVAVQQLGALNWRVCYVDQWDKKDLNYTTGKILMLTQEQMFEQSVIDEDGIGAGPLDMLNKGRGLSNFLGFRNSPLGFKDDQFYGNIRTRNIFKVKDMVLKGHLEIDDEALIKELCSIRYKFTHDQRRILVSKDEMRKQGFKSPNLADALIMAVSLIGEFKYKQDRQYYHVPQYSVDTNLFQTAGIR